MVVRDPESAVSFSTETFLCPSGDDNGVRRASLAVVAASVLLAGCGAVPPILGDTPDRPSSAGAATSLSGPECLTELTPHSAGTVTVLPNETDAGVSLNTTVTHDRGERPDVTLTRTSPGVYTLFVTTVGQETPPPGETATPERVRDRCQVGNRVESHGRMDLKPDRIRVVVGETVLNRTVPESRTTWEVPRVIEIGGTNGTDTSVTGD